MLERNFELEDGDKTAEAIGVAGIGSEVALGTDMVLSPRKFMTLDEMGVVEGKIKEGLASPVGSIEEVFNIVGGCLPNFIMKPVLKDAGRLSYDLSWDVDDTRFSEEGAFEVNVGGQAYLIKVESREVLVCVKVGKKFVLCCE